MNEGYSLQFSEDEFLVCDFSHEQSTVEANIHGKDNDKNIHIWIDNAESFINLRPSEKKR